MAVRAQGNAVPQIVEGEQLRSGFARSSAIVLHGNNVRCFDLPCGAHDTRIIVPLPYSVREVGLLCTATRGCTGFGRRNQAYSASSWEQRDGIQLLRRRSILQRRMLMLVRVQLLMFSEAAIGWRSPHQQRRP